ncbi:MAG: SDR family NAD(P)-dependent oxidoreductase [Streptosporangiaceae bacterium]
MKPVLEGTVALVTGASSGIGAATAAALAGQGAAVALAARRRDRLEELAGEIRGQGGTALVLECDVTDQAQAAAAVERTAAELGRLDTLVNNAGVMLLGPAAGAPLAEWQQMVELNVLGLLYCAHAALPHLRRAATDGPRQVADMVNLSSVAGRFARTGNGVYALTKFGVGAFSESLRQELAGQYVRVSVVEPGATATELAGHNRPEVLEAIRNQFGQRMEATDIADAISYIVTRPRHVAVNEMLIRPTEQQR